MKQTRETNQLEEPKLYKSLLLDAELNRQGDPRISILYAALACEVFIQNFCQEQAKGVVPVLTWLGAARNPDSAASIHILYDLGLRMLGKKSLKENKKLRSDFEKLVNARNDIAHRGRIERNPNGYTPDQAINTAKNIIEWVETHA